MKNVIIMFITIVILLIIAFSFKDKTKEIDWKTIHKQKTTIKR